MWIQKQCQTTIHVIGNSSLDYEVMKRNIDELEKIFHLKYLARPIFQYFDQILKYIIFTDAQPI